jgi:hypothetical protein
MGCALSHFTLWHHIARTNDQQHLILEDDAMFIEDFVDTWNSKYYYGFPLNSFVSLVDVTDGGIRPSSSYVSVIFDSEND